MGRTGSGKSSTALCLLRFVEAMSGSITIDGLDISKVALSELRKRITVIPQEASLFQGTVRRNMSVEAEHDDADMVDALRRVGLMDGEGRPDHGVIRSLDDEVSEGGKSLSAGQRQLLALARGLLKLQFSGIAVMDEASSSLGLSVLLGFR